QGCTLLREKLEEDLVTYFQNFQNTSESSDVSTNVVNAPREPVVVKQDHGVNPPRIDECCCECGNALDGIYCQQCICKVFEIKDTLGTKQYKPEDLQELFHKLSNDVQNINEELAEYINTPGWNRPAFYDDDDDDVDYKIAIAPVLSTEELVDFLSMGDEHLNTIPATESNEVIKSSVKDLIPIPSESEGIPKHTKPSSTSLNSLLEETNTFDTSLPEFETFCFDVEEISSGSTTTFPDISLLEYEAFHF
nr:hypothetical protein [Tanacetum cinerariifolium]